MTITHAEFLNHWLLLSLFFGFEMPKPEVLAKAFQLVNEGLRRRSSTAAPDRAPPRFLDDDAYELVYYAYGRRYKWGHGR